MHENAQVQRPQGEFKPYIAPETQMKELTPRAIILGCIFGVLFGAATVYLALKAGLTVSASIPVAVLAMSIGSKFFKTTISNFRNVYWNDGRFVNMSFLIKI